MTTVAHERPIDLTVTVRVPGAEIEGDWSVPPTCRGTIIFANGTGTSRLCRRNRDLAHKLYDAGFATLLLDLLSQAEENENALTGALRLDVPLFTERLLAAIHWMKEDSGEGDLPLGILASGPASAAALSAAARENDLVKAIVSRGGRPDLAGIDLHRVLVPTLLIVGNADPGLYELNRWALRRLNGEKHLVVIPGESQAFEEKKALDHMCRVAIEWFNTHMQPGTPLRAGQSAFDVAWTLNNPKPPISTR